MDKTKLIMSSKLHLKTLLYFYYPTEKINVHNLTDNNTLSALAESIQNIITILESESNVIVS